MNIVVIKDAEKMMIIDRIISGESGVLKRESTADAVSLESNVPIKESNCKSN